MNKRNRPVSTGLNLTLFFYSKVYFVFEQAEALAEYLEQPLKQVATS